jgi:hypothetical protein
MIKKKKKKTMMMSILPPTALGSQRRTIYIKLKALPFPVPPFTLFLLSSCRFRESEWEYHIAACVYSLSFSESIQGYIFKLTSQPPAALQFSFVFFSIFFSFVNENCLLH